MIGGDSCLAVAKHVFWSWSGYDLATIKPKTTSLNLSRNFRSNSGAGKNPAKCFQPETSKSPCKCLGNENGQNKMSSNEPKSMQMFWYTY